MTISTEQSLSPMMLQWHACKQKAGSSLLFFRLGDFYEAFYDDAVLIAKELDLTLTKRQEIPMAGVPFHSSEGYIDRLVALGYSVAIAEQMEDPRQVKGIVKRAIVRTVTPGTVISSSLLTDKAHNFLACITQIGNTHGLAVLDVTTADFRVMEFEEIKQLSDELCRLAPKELLLSVKWHKKHGGLLEELKAHFSFSTTIKEEWHFDPLATNDFLLRHFQVHNLEGFGLKGMVAAIHASGAVLRYVHEELRLAISHIKSLSKELLSSSMLIDRATQKHLELTESLYEGKKTHTLLHLLDETETPMGGRLLKKWLIYPLTDPCEIGKRQEAVGELIKKREERLELKKQLKSVRDLERLMMRIETGYASPRDLAGLRNSLEPLASVRLLLNHFSSPLLENVKGQMADLSSLLSTLQNALVEAPPLRLSDGDIFKTGFHPLLDELRLLKSDSHAWIARYQTELRDSSQIKTLKVGFTRAFGYYIEISRGQTSRVPENFQRRQTLTNAERYITPELKEFEHRMLHAEEKIAALELECFHTLLQEVKRFSAPLLQTARSIGQADLLLSLATCAERYRWVKPLVDSSDLFEVEAGRHPVIEAQLQRETFVPNDVHLNASSQRMYLITGPNMAGKSTFIRQAALIAILAQMGSFVPAQRAHIGIIDKVFSRIGASDDLARGQSTFMVEMTETANILNNATDRSLVILDEIGRGTSTYDGISIAWAVAEYLLTQPGRKAKTLFATHYWELTELEKKIPGAANFNIAVHESEEGIIFLRKIVKGGTDKSYGIHVAKLAGLPSSVIQRATTLLAELEASGAKISKTQVKKTLQAQQLSLFDVR